MSLKPKVALSQDFLLQLAKLPGSVQTKVMKWAILFQSNPTSPGINYEKIAVRDPNLKSIRIDQDWRGIVFKPDSGDVYVLLYVDHHDNAYRWAERRKLSINPVTGAMQVVLVQEVASPVEVQSSVHPPGVTPEPSFAAHPVEVGPALFDALSDHDLMGLGVPEDRLSRARTIRSELELDTLQDSLPIEAYEGLFLLAAGDTVAQVLSARETRLDRTIDTNDFASALSTPESQSRFVVVDDDAAMLAIMNAPLAQWRIFLHPTQLKLASGTRSGPVRVLGGAGTGKTVVAMHRAKWLAENATPEGKKVLFTTFTKNLATDIEENLKTLCSRATMAKIEVRNLDAWVHAFMRARRLEHRIVYGLKSDGADQAWQMAMAGKDDSIKLPDSFYEQELEQVILAQGITTRDAYRTARRTGRGVVLSRATRDAVWPVFEEYRGQLTSRKLKTVDDAYREIAELLNKEKVEGSEIATYSAILVDETQDFGPQALKLLRAMIPAASNDLFFVGDGHQRIYSRHRAAMSKCGIDIRGRSRKLYLNYRTTDEIRLQAVAFLENCEIDDLDEGQDESRRYKSLSHGPTPEVLSVDGVEGAAGHSITTVQNWLMVAAEQAVPTICIIAYSEAVRNSIAKLCSGAGIATQIIDAIHRAVPVAGTVQFATMHRAKGLEFDHVIVVAPQTYLGDPLETENQRKLIYVALTRAKREALLLKV